MELFTRLRCFLFVLIIYQIVQCTNSGSVDTDLTITRQQKLILDKITCGSKTAARLHEEGYISHQMAKRYLNLYKQAKDFDIPGARLMLMNNIRWRRMNKMDTILQEDFSDMEKQFPYYIDTYSLNGKTGVVAYGDAGTWDTRIGVLQGKRERMVRYLDRHLELVTKTIRDLQVRGYNITQYDLVINLADFDIIQHFCNQCVLGFIEHMISYENYFPGTVRKIYMINVPTIIDILLYSVKRFVSPRTRDAVQLYGRNKADWQSKLFNDIPPDVLPIKIGGKKYFI